MARPGKAEHGQGPQAQSEGFKLSKSKTTFKQSSRDKGWPSPVSTESQALRGPEAEVVKATHNSKALTFSLNRQPAVNQNFGCA
jgi:hypothetical protein